MNLFKKIFLIRLFVYFDFVSILHLFSKRVLQYPRFVEQRKVLYKFLYLSRNRRKKTGFRSCMVNKGGGGETMLLFEL